MSLNVEVIISILAECNDANAAVPVSMAALIGPRSSELIGRFRVGAVELMRLTRDLDQNKLSRDALLDLADLLCRIGNLADSGVRTHPGPLTKGIGLQYVRLYAQCLEAISGFDDSLIPERHKDWRQTTG